MDCLASMDAFFWCSGGRLKGNPELAAVLTSSFASVTVTKSTGGLFGIARAVSSSVSG